MFRLVILIAVFTLAHAHSLTDEALADEEEALTVEEIQKIWDGRRERIRSASIKWTQDRTDFKGVAGAGEPGKLVDRDIHSVTLMAFSFDATRARRHYWSPRDGFPRMTWIFAGGVSTYLFLPRADDQEHYYPTASTSSKMHFGLMPEGVLSRWYTGPGVKSPAGSRLNGYSVSEFPGEIEGKEYLVLVEEDIVRRHRNEYWLDPRRDYVCVRETTTIRDEPRSRTDIEYQEDKTLGWMVSSWQRESWRRGAPERTIRCAITEYSINKPLPDEDFQITFPPGTSLRDEDADKGYVILMDGQKSEITRNESSAARTYADLLQARGMKRGPLNAIVPLDASTDSPQKPMTD